METQVNPFEGIFITSFGDVKVEIDAIHIFDVEAEVTYRLRWTCYDSVSELVEKEDEIVFAQAEALKFGFSRVESEAELIYRFAEVEEDGL